MDEYPIVDLSHLLPAAQGLARLPADERIQRIRADRWIGYPRAVEALNRLETLFAWPNKQRMPNLLLIGPTNNGKSMIVEKFRRSHPAVTLWEQRQALAKLRQQGREQVDESALFRMIGQMREIVTTAQKATRKARRDADRRQHLKATTPPVKAMPPPDAEMADPQADKQPPAKPFDQIEEW